MKPFHTAILASSLYLFPHPAQSDPNEPVNKPMVDLYHLKKELPLLGEQGIFDGYDIHRIGSVTFPDCKFNNGDGIDAVSRKLQSYDLRDKVIVLYGSTDTRSSKKCLSKSDEYLSGHRAVSILIDLEARLGDHLRAAHVDIIAGGTGLNRRAVNIYVLEKRKMEVIENPFDPF